MLYLDSSALVKRYVFEPGTDALNARMAAEESSGEPLFTSVLSYVEVQRALTTKLKDKTLSRVAFDQAKRNFEADWTVGLTIVELGANVLLFVPDILEHTDLRSGDAIQLASALWVRDFLRLSSKHGWKGSKMSFTTADRGLEQAAATYKIETFNPQTKQFP